MTEKGINGVCVVTSKLKARLEVFRAWLPSWLTILRGSSLCVFLWSTFSISISWTSALALLVFIVSIYGVDNNSQDPKEAKDDPWTNPNFNPLKGKPRQTALGESREREVGLAIGNFVSDYDPHNCAALERFEPVKQGSECLFARQAKLWGCRDWNPELSLEGNVFRSLPMFLKFCLVCQELGLDGFLFLLPGDQYGSDPETLGQAVRRVLQTLSDADPAGFCCMDRSYLGKRGWVFEFQRLTFFITTFAPFYPASNSRYAHGAKDAFILFQPEISFAQHDLPPDTVKTNWDHPVTVRDRIRRGFRDAGRGYKIREVVTYPVAHDIVKPVNEGEDASVVQWWLKS